MNLQARLIGLLIAVLAISGLFFYIYHLKSQILERDSQITTLVAANSIYKANETTLLAAAEEDKKTIQSLMGDHDKSLKIIADLKAHPQVKYVQGDYIAEKNTSTDGEIAPVLKRALENLR